MRADSAVPKTSPGCAPPRATAAHASRVERALRTQHDVWGNALLSAPDGPTYEAARRLLPPLLYARAPGKKALTESGVYYVPFGQPLGARGAGSVALHVADGSQVIAERVGGRRLTIFVGATGRERYGSCLARLGPRAARCRLPADHVDDLRRFGARALPAGVVRGADVRDGLARQLHPARRRRAARLDESRSGQAEAVGAKAAQRARLQPRRHRQAVGADLPGQARHEADDLSRLDQLPGAAHPRRRRGPLRARAARRRRVLERAAAGGDADHGPGAARQRRLPQPPDPEPAPDLALQHRQPVRAVLLPRGGRRRRGDGRARLRRRGAVDHADLADAEGRALSELEDGQAARRVGLALPAHARPGLHRGRDADAATLRRRARAPDRRERHGAARPGAVFLGHPGRSAGAALAGDRLAGPVGDEPRLGGDGEPRAGAALRGARETARGRHPPRGRLLAAATGRRLAVHPGAAARPRARLRVAHAGAPRQLLEPRDAVRARLGDLRPREPGGGRCSHVHAPARIAPRRRRPRGRLRALRAAGLPGLRHRPGLRDQRGPLPGGRRRRPTSSCSASTARWPWR